MNKIRSFIRLLILNKKARLITIGSATAILLIGCIVGVIVFRANNNSVISVDIPSTTDDDSDFTYITPTLDDIATATQMPEPVIDEEVTSFVPATEMDLEPSSITVFVNKEYALPQSYRPGDLVTPNIRFDILTYDERTLMRSEAAKAIERLFAAAENQGYYLSGVSGYRSYARQFKIFTNNIATQGKTHTLQYSAVPGTSEHQTGLAMDVSIESLRYKLIDDFAGTSEGIWLAENAYKYGFIIRYPKDKSDITGYAYEPWHIRYVGRGLSYYLYNNNLTLDEYYHYTPDPDFDFEAVYADIINYVAPTVTVTVTPTIEPSIEPTIPADSEPDDNNPGDDNGHPDDGTGATPVPSPTQIPTVTVKPSQIPSNPGDSDGQDGSTDKSAATIGAMDILIE